MTYDELYEKKVVVNRVLKKLKFFLSSAHRQNRSAEELTDFLRSHNAQHYEGTISFAFLQVLKSECFSECDRILAQERAIIDDFNFVGEVPLHVAVRRNSIPMLLYVLSKQPQMEVRNFFGLTPLGLAISLKHL